MEAWSTSGILGSLWKSTPLNSLNPLESNLKPLVVFFAYCSYTCDMRHFVILWTRQIKLWHCAMVRNYSSFAMFWGEVCYFSKLIRLKSFAWRIIKQIKKKKTHILDSLTWTFTLCFIWQVDVVCGDHLLKQYQSLREVCNTMGQNALQVGVWYNIPFSYHYQCIHLNAAREI